MKGDEDVYDIFRLRCMSICHFPNFWITAFVIFYESNIYQSKKKREKKRTGNDGLDFSTNKLCPIRILYIHLSFCIFMDMHLMQLVSNFGMNFTITMLFPISVNKAIALQNL